MSRADGLVISPTRRARPTRRTRVLVVLVASACGLLLWGLFGFGPEPVPEIPPSTESVRVLVRSDAKRLWLEAERGLALDGESSRPVGTQLEIRLQPAGFLLVRPQADPIVLDQESLLVRWEGVALARFAPEQEAQRWYGALALEHGEEGLRVIPHVELERYLSGVLSKEMSPGFTPAALAAQAVAARSYVQQSKTRSATRSYDVFGDTRSQVYRGASEHPRILRAIAATRGQVLRWEGRVLRCYYHSTCGGRTRGGKERFADVPEEPLRSVECQGCAISPVFRWTKRIAPEAWVKLGLPGLPEKISVRERSPRGDWKEVELRAKSGEPVRVTGAELRRALGLRSPWIDDVTEAGRTRVVHGRGFGHGVGMCQYGAEGYGRQGWTWQQILAHYYPDAELSPLQPPPAESPR